MKPTSTLTLKLENIHEVLPTARKMKDEAQRLGFVIHIRTSGKTISVTGTDEAFTALFTDVDPAKN